MELLLVLTKVQVLPPRDGKAICQIRKIVFLFAAA